MKKLGFIFSIIINLATTQALAFALDRDLAQDKKMAKVTVKFSEEDLKEKKPVDPALRQATINRLKEEIKIDGEMLDVEEKLPKDVVYLE
jgi:hypothetical protein